MFGDKSILRSWFLQLPLAALLLSSMHLSALPPSWWQQPDNVGRRVVYPSVINSNNFAPANVGQAKFMAKRAIETLRMYAPVVANNIEADLVGVGKIIPSWDVPAPGSEMAKQQYAPLQIGQLKAIADPFYTRLNTHNSTWLNGQLVANLTKDPGDNTNFFPWTTATGDDENKAVATIGQLKAVFALHFEKLEVTAPDENSGNMARLSVVGNMVVRVTDSVGGRLGGVKLQFTRLKGNGTFAGGVTQKTFTTNSAGEVELLPADYSSPEDDLVRVSMLTQQGRQNVWLPANVSVAGHIVRTGSGGYNFPNPERHLKGAAPPPVPPDTDPPDRSDPVHELMTYLAYEATHEVDYTGSDHQGPYTGNDKTRIEWDPEEGVRWLQLTTKVTRPDGSVVNTQSAPEPDGHIMAGQRHGLEINGYQTGSGDSRTKARANMELRAVLPGSITGIDLQHAVVLRYSVGGGEMTETWSRKDMRLKGDNVDIDTPLTPLGDGNGAVTSFVGPFVSCGEAQQEEGVEEDDVVEFDRYVDWKDLEKNYIPIAPDHTKSLRAEVMVNGTGSYNPTSFLFWRVESSNENVYVSVRTESPNNGVEGAVPFDNEYETDEGAERVADLRIKCKEGENNAKSQITLSLYNRYEQLIVQKKFWVEIEGSASSQNPESHTEGNLTKTITNNESSGPKYRKIALDGTPLADEKPQSAAETDEADEETYVDALTRELRHSTTDIYVPVPGSDLALTVRRNIVSEIWNPTSGLRPKEDPTLAFGPVWRTNLAAHVNIIEQVDKNGLTPEANVPEDGSGLPAASILVAQLANSQRGGGAMTQRDPNYAFVTDEDGASHRFMIGYGGSSGRYFVPSPTDKNEMAAHQVSLDIDGEDGLVFKKLHGNTLRYQKCIYFPLDRVRRAGIGAQNGTTDGGELAIDASEFGGGVSNVEEVETSLGTAGGGQMQAYYYYRLISVTDRFGTELQYEYPDTDSGEDIVPTAIRVKGRPNLAIHINSVNGEIRSVSDPNGNLTVYHYESNGNGTLVQVTVDNVPTASYTYSRWEETDYRRDAGSGGGVLLPWVLTGPGSNPLENPAQLFQYGEKVQHFDLASITDGANNTYTFDYRVDKSHITTSVSNAAVPTGGLGTTLGSYLENGTLMDGGRCFVSYPLAGFPPDVRHIGLPGGGIVDIGDRNEVSSLPGEVQHSPFGQRHTTVRDAEGNRRTYSWDKGVTVAVDQQMMGYTQEITIGVPPGGLTNSVLDIEALESEQPRETPAPSGSTTLHTFYTRLAISHDKGGLETYVFDFLAGGSLASVTDFSGNTTKYRYGIQPGLPAPTTPVRTFPGGISPTILSTPTAEVIPLLTGYSDEEITPLNRTTRYVYGHQGMMCQRLERNGLVRDFGVDEMGRTRQETVKAGSTVLADTQIVYHSDVFGSGYPGFPIRRTIKKLGSTDPSWVQDMSTLYEPDALGRIWKEVSDMNGDGLIDGGDLITTYEYDRNGNKLSTTNPEGLTTWFHYDKRNRLVGTVFPDGTQASAVYDKRGKKVLERDENGVATGYLYDQRGRMTKSIRDMNGNLAHSANGLTGVDPAVDIINETVYDRIGLAIQMKDARGYISVTEYDHLRRPVRSIAPGSTRLPGQVPTASADDVTTFFYDQQFYYNPANAGASCFNVSGFKPTKVVDPRGFESYFVYDELYRCKESLTQYALASGPSPALYAKKWIDFHPITGVLEKVREPRKAYGSNDAPVDNLAVTGGREVNTTYDPLFRPQAVKEKGLDLYLSGESELSTFYTSTGLVWKTKKKLSSGVFAEIETKYDRAARVTNVWAPLVPVYDSVAGIATTAKPETITAYDRSGVVISKQDPGGNITTFVHDARGRQIEQISPLVYDYDASRNRSPVVTTTYDKVGNVVRVTDPRGYSIATDYDAANRPVKVISPSYQESPTSPVVTPVTQTVYDASGNPTKVTDARGSVTINTYGSQNRLIQTKANPVVAASSNSHAEDMVTTFSWDKAGNRTLVVDAAQQHTSFEYDGFNRLTATIWDSNDAARKKTERAAYDALVQTTKTDPRGNVITYQYSDRLFVTGSTCSDPAFAGDAESRTYDSGGRLLTVTATGSTVRSVSYTYDALDQVKLETSAGSTHQYEYDRAGNRTRVTYGKTNRILVSRYDALNRLSRITDSSRVTDYKYDVAGNLRERLQANSTREVSVYDALGRRKSQKTTNGSIPVSCFDYFHDPVGNLARIEEEYSSTSVPDRIVTNTYDRQGRLVTETADSLNSSNAVTKSVLTTYSYSKANNRTLKNLQVTEGGVLTENVDQSYSYGNAQNGKNSNQLDSYLDGATAQTTSYTYDAAGNRETKSVNGALKETYGWDSRGRLTSLNGTGSADDYTYGYDCRSRRVIRNESGAGGANTTVSFSGGSSVFETVGSATQVEFIRGSDYGGGIGGILYSLRGSNPDPRFNAYNSRGDVVAQTGTNGTVTWQATYEAFGTRTEEDGNNPDRQKANTKEEDPTGLLNEGFRYRDLATGMFISRDPLGFVDGANVYTYVRQNPWTAFDPLGLQSNFRDLQSPTSYEEYKETVEDYNRNQQERLMESARLAEEKAKIEAKYKEGEITFNDYKYATNQWNAKHEAFRDSESHFQREMGYAHGRILHYLHNADSNGNVSLEKAKFVATDQYNMSMGGGYRTVPMLDPIDLAVGYGVGKAMLRTTVIPSAAKGAGSSTTRLFRAVEADELADVMKYGDYNIHPNSTFKRFALEESSLDDFIKANPNRSYTKTSIDVPTENLGQMYRHGDPGGVGKAIGIDVYENPHFYDWFDKVNIIGQ